MCVCVYIHGLQFLKIFIFSCVGVWLIFVVAHRLFSCDTRAQSLWPVES